MSIDEFSGIDQMIDPALQEVGFAVGVVRGVRAFNVDKLGRLRGVTFPQVWMPGENQAECKRNERDIYQITYRAVLNLSQGGYATPIREPEPEPTKPHAMNSCNHGFYAYYDGSNDYHDPDRVNAVIEGYGETVIGSRGFRCMKARIIAMHIPDTMTEFKARMVARNYPDVAVLESFEQMVAEFPPDAAGNEITPDNDPDFWTRPA
ncbi:hypothetical protein ACTJJ4_11800 [Microbacterium sp. 22195]|uniref:hypothetical protein n=1 Tax=Microbacterium sp. 22195 TaxID=3453891 RepID=UPI003F87AA63